MHQRVKRFVFVTCVATIGIWGTARAADLTVTSLDDSGAGTLRDALAVAAANGEADTITFGVTGTIVLTSRLPTIDSDVELDGPGATLLEISGDGAVPVLHVTGGVVTIRGLTIADGLAAGADGATTVEWRAGGGGGGLGAGGGLWVQDATVALEALVFDGNEARGGDGGEGGPGTNIGFPGGLGGNGGASSLGAAGGMGGGSAGNGGGGGGAGGGLGDGGNGGMGNAGGGGGRGGSTVGGLGNGAGGSGAGCGGGSQGFQVPGEFGGDGGVGIENCTGSGGGGGGGAGLGGALYLHAGSLSMVDVTFQANRSVRGAGGTGGSGGGPGRGKGGALFVDTAGSVTVATNVVFSGNAADDALGGCDDNDDFFRRGTFVFEAPTDVALSSSSVAEDVAIDTLVGLLTTTDPTVDDTHTYALVDGAGADDNATFTIVGDELRTNALLDHETQPTLALRVRTTDDCGQGFERSLLVVVTDVDEIPPRVTAVANGTGGAIEPCSTVRMPVPSLAVTFDEPMNGAAAVPTSYLVLAAGVDADFATSDCTGAQGDDQVLPVDSAKSDGDPATPTVTLDLAHSLPNGLVRLLVCPSVGDLLGNPLDGDGDGIGGDTFVHTFRIDGDNLFVNGHLDRCPVTLSPWQTLVTPPDMVVTSDEDADGSSLSASVRVMSVTAAASTLAQCVDGVDDVWLSLEARVRLDAFDGATATLTGFCELFDGAACTGNSLGLAASATAVPDLVGDWSEARFRLIVPGGVPASAVCGVEIAPDDSDTPAFDAFFDALTLRRPQFSDGFESGDTAAWTVTVP